MKSLKKIFSIGLVAASSLFCINNTSAQPISSHFFGQNAWMPDTVGNVAACSEPPCFYNGKLHANWDNIKKSKASIIRYGGIAGDKNMPTNYQYIRIIDSIRAIGMEPVIQVPFYNYRFNASQAAAIVNYLNVVKGKNIKYWIIANEPDLSYSFNSSSQIANYFRPFASAMKAVDPSILIVGPELSWFQKPVIDGLTNPGGVDDITGKDAAGRYYLDVISFHSYSFDGTQTRAQAITKLTSTTGLQSSLVHLNTRVAASNAYHNRTGAAAIKTAITEANIGWQNPATDNLYSVGANSFLGGQFVAELFGVAMKNGVDFVNIWSVIEGNSVPTNCGFIDPSTHNKKPLYYHFQMMAENFKGTYLGGSGNQANVKVMGSKNSSQIIVMVMNQELTTNFNFTVGLNSTSVGGSSALKMNVDAGIAREYTDNISSQSTILLRFDPSGNLVEKTEYKLNGHADVNLPPTVTPMIATGIETHTLTPDYEFQINVFPNPSVGKFTVALDKKSPDERTFEVEIYNLIGQSVYRKKFLFVDGKEEIELNPSIASGTYVVRIKQGDQMVTKKIILNK